MANNPGHQSMVTIQLRAVAGLDVSNQSPRNSSRRLVKPLNASVAGRAPDRCRASFGRAVDLAGGVVRQVHDVVLAVGLQDAIRISQLAPFFKIIVLLPYPVSTSTMDKADKPSLPSGSM